MSSQLFLELFQMMVQSILELLKGKERLYLLLSKLSFISEDSVGVFGCFVCCEQK